MKKTPSIYTLENLVRTANSVQAWLPDGRWVPARPEGFWSIRYRWKAAWLVWTGRADAVIWPGQ
jgi:hypothetical protein